MPDLDLNAALQRVKDMDRLGPVEKKAIMQMPPADPMQKPTLFNALTQQPGTPGVIAPAQQRTVSETGDNLTPASSLSLEQAQRLHSLQKMKRD